ncbi:MAG TPA: hypothetical protein VGL76_06260 [Gaiellaceae bacterium]
MLGRGLTVALVALAAGFSAGAAKAVLPSIYVNYNSANCTFAVTNDASTSIGSPAPGEYQLVISTHDPYGLLTTGSGTLQYCGGYVQFQMTGPGVSISTTLDYGDATQEIDQVTLQASGAYTMLDNNNPSASKFSFSAAATGSASSVASGSSSSKSTGSSSQASPVGANALVNRGALSATLAATGKVSFKRAGKAALSIPAGIYKLTVSDKSKSSGLLLQLGSGKPKTITARAFTGSHTVTITLKAGHWTAYSSSGGTKTTLFVLS